MTITCTILPLIHVAYYSTHHYLFSRLHFTSTTILWYIPLHTIHITIPRDNRYWILRKQFARLFGTWTCSTFAYLMCEHVVNYGLPANIYTFFFDPARERKPSPSEFSILWVMNIVLIVLLQSVGCFHWKTSQVWYRFYPTMPCSPLNRYLSILPPIWTQRRNSRSRYLERILRLACNTLPLAIFLVFPSGS